MFSKKLHVDVKKSTLKIQDVKKDSATRFKHLKIVLENVDTDEAKGFFEGNFSHVYFILYDCFVSAEANLRQRVQRAHREELEQVLQLLEKVLTLLPELLNRRWQCHSLARILQKLLHPGNSWKLRREAIRYFILWYQALGENAPNHIHQMFASLVPGFPPQQQSPYKSDRRSDGKKDKLVKATGCDDRDKKEFYDTQMSQSTFHDSSFNQCPVTPVDNGPILPPQSGEKPLDNETVRFLEALLEFMVSQVVKIEWRDKSSRQHKTFQFLLERFKATYLRYICPEFDDNFSLYKPNLELPTMRKPTNQSQDVYVLCKVALIKWIASFTHIARKDARVAHLSHSTTPNEEHTEPELRRVSVTQSSADSSLLSPDSSMSQPENQNQEDSTVTAVTLVRDVLYSNRDNVNFVHELYRQAFLLDFNHAGAIRKAIAVYKDWIQMNELPPFMLEPLDGHKERDLEENAKRDGNDIDKSPSESYRQTRLRNDSYLGAIHRENLFIRAGLQNVLQIFITQASNVFFLENSGPSASLTLLEEQTDSCKRVLNVYRYVVMNSRLEPATWEQLLRVLLQITSLVLNEKSSRRKVQESIGGKLAPAIFQTLIVTWIKANLNVIISTQLWDQFLEVLTSLTQWEELIREWAKTLDTLTRVLARHVYNLDLNDLPLDRLSEQKTKRRRGVGSRAASTGSVQPPRKGSVDQDNNTVSEKNVIDHPIRDLRKVRPLPRSASDNTIYSAKARTKLHRSRVHTVHSGIPVLPLSIEQDMARLLSNSSATSSSAGRKMLPNRRAKSLDSIVIVDSEPPSPRCPSPTPSSGVDSNKDSPIQIENIDGSSIDTNDASERRSVMAGGGVRGWLPDVAVVLWRRMLSALGDVNNIQDPTLHGQVMDYLVQLTQTLIKIRLNQGVSGDNQATPPAPELIPPLTVIAPWCFKAIQLPSQYEVGKLAAYRLICLLTVQPQDINLPKQHLTLFYRAVHNGIVSNDNKVLHVLVKYTGPRLFSLNLPGSSLLILDYIHAANVILSGHDIEAPRTEAVSIIGSLLSLPATTTKLPVLQPTGSDIVTMTCPDAKEHIITILLRSCRREPTGIARCVALSSIAMFVYKELCYKNQHPKIPEAVTVLLLALRASHATVAQVACDSLLLLCDKADTLLELYPNVPCKIIQILSETLGYMSTRERRGPLTISMLFCLGEWAMHLGPSVLLRVFQGKPLLMTMFTVLDNVVQDKIGKDGSQSAKTHEDEDDDFDPDITLDNLADDACAKSPRRGNVQSVQLAAKMVMMHLINHLGHFPMGIGAARLSSLVVELDDVPGIDGDELSSAIFHAPNIQLLMLSNSIIMSLVELAALDAPGGGVTAGLTTAPSLVRVLLRDLAGKASWDSSILYSQPFVEDDTPVVFTKHVEWKSKTHEEDLSSVTTSQTCTPRHTIRHREPHILPTFANAASDMDNLDDLLQYIGYTSPEVLTNPEIALNEPANPPQGLCLESETIATILNQRNAEQEHINNWNQHISMCASAISPPSCRAPPAPFHHCRLLFSHLGLSGWEQRRKLHLLSKNEKLLRELRNLDSQRSRETHKIAVIYVSQGQEDKNSILSNVTASKEYESFVARLAWEVELESHTGFLGGLVPGKASGVTAPYFATSFTEILFHVATRMPSDSPESLLQKTRHLGNDEVHIVWSEHWRDYRRDIIPTEFCDVLIVIYPLHNKLYRIQISRKPEIPFFGPLFDECIVEDKVLPGLVRTTALAASRAKRSTLTLYQHYYEERARSIDTVMRNHKEATTFEEFTANVYSPVQPPSPFSGASSVSGSTTSVQSTASSNLAAALIDSHQGRSGLRSSSAASSDNRANRAYTGSILVAVNPYKEVDFYTYEYVNRYHGQKMGSLEPHVFALAEAAYRSLQDTESNQSCVISGESGAGKTETTKFILQYLCSVTSNVDTWVEQQILEANTILEAFGNAKTVRNDNSSRFGKFMQVCFDSKWMIKGCIIQDYLLEQSRITFQSGGERNYHVFYQLVEAGTRDKEFAEQYKLMPASHYKYLNQSGCVKIDGIFDSKKLDALRLAFNVLQVAPEMCEGIFRVLSAILWLGNLSFEDVDGERCELTKEDLDIVNTVAPLLGLQVEDLTKVVLIRQINVRGNITEIPLKVQEARENRHAMAKALYSRTFAWLINHINNCTNPGQDSSRFLGVLDIFGFENFAVNSFEQLCINYTNEKLHKFFNHYVFALEQELYRQEEIQYSHITFTDNTMCLELIEKPPRCVLKLLTEQCHMPKGSDLAYLTNLHAEFESHPCYVKGDDRRKWETEFGVKHYAGCVTYTVEGFVDKNRDVQQDVFFDFMSRSTNEFVQEITVYQDLLGCTVARASGNATTMSRGTSKGKPTLCDSFRHQLQALVDVLQATTPWYARCIKPNMQKVANHYDEKLVLDQLKYLGMLDIIRIRKEGFPIHMPFNDFIARYRCLDKGRVSRMQNEKDAVRCLISNQGIPETEWQIGNSKVFLRSYVHEPLEDCRNQMVTSNAIMIQKIWRGFIVRREYKRVKEAALKVQHAYRGWKLRIMFIRKRRAAIVIQSHLRGVFAREVATALREMRRVDEEMRKRERMEEERRLMEDKKALEESQSAQYNGIVGMEAGKAQEEIAALSQMAEQMNSKMAASDLQSVDLDNLFSFLSDVQSTKGNQIIEEIGEQMDELIEDLDVELETVIQQEIEKNSKAESKANTPNGQEAPALPQQASQQRIPGATSGKLGQPSLPEPTEPPPPPPPPATSLTMNGDSSTDNGEPIYESVLPRDESSPSSPILVNGNSGSLVNGESCGSPPPVPNNNVIKEPIAGSPPSRPESRNSNSHHLHHNHHQPVPQQQQNGHDQPQQPSQQSQQPPVEREQRRKCRVERKLQELEDKKEPDNEVTYHDIVEFAQNYFNSHERSPEGTIMATLTRKSRGKSVEYIPKYEMVTYYKGSTIPNSHIHMYDPDNVNVACSVFRDLCKYIRGEMKLDQEIATIQSIIGYGIEREELRDEIFVQCMRQATNNPNPEWAERVWLLLCLAIVAFQPSKLLYKYFVSFLRKNLALEGKLRQYVQWCVDNCKNMKVSCRQHPPSTVEIAAMRRLGTIVCRFFFLDGRTKAIDVHPTDTAADAVAKLGEKLGLRSLEGWAIYQSRPDGEEHVRAHDYLYDVIAAWEMKQCKLNTAQSTFSTLRRGNNATLGSGDNRFVFKRRLFRNTREISQDPVEVNMLYAQAVYNVVKCDDFPVSEKVALQLAGLQAQVALGDPKDNDRLDYYSEVDSFLPYRISRARGDDVWVPIIAQAHRQYGAGRKELAAKVLYLSCVMQYPLYGTTMFNVTYRGYWSYGNQLILGINCDGLMLIKPDDKFVLSEYRYQDVESIMLDPSDSFITLSLLRHNPDSSHKCFVFETAQKNEIGSLIVSYCPALAGWITENEVPTKKLKCITNEDRIRLYHNLVNCRRTLVDAEILRKPQDSGGGFLRNTLRRLSKHRIEKLRQEHGSATDHGETYKGFPYAYWAFSRQAVPQSLSKLPDPDEQVALNVFQLILTYAGLGQNGDTVRRVEDEHVNLIQTVMERCIRKENLLGELYLQLIKQTTDHPDPNSRVNLRHWALLSLACSVILPPQKVIRKYLIAHLKRCASDYVTEEGKYARFAEKCLYKTQGTRRRQWPPSREEIMCTINRRPIYARFHFMDGQYHAVEFHPSATARDVMEIIKTKIGLEETAMGYAIYEVLGPTERALIPEEKIADVMSKWERYRTANAQQNQAQRKHAHHFFLFKKHLFLDQYMNLDDPVEKELLYHQVLHDLRADRFPITEKEAMMLTALQAQLELGDCEDTVSDHEYRTISSHCLPPRLVPNLCIEGVLQHHQSLRGMSPPEAKKAFLNLIQSWPLHRATIFDVMQSFTSNWPRVLWLAVDQQGLHLLEHRSRNTLCTYEYSSILSYSPAVSCLMIITGTDKKQSKVILTTSQAHQIANLIREYMDVLQSPPEVPKRESAIAQQIAQQPIQQPPTTLSATAGGRKSRPASVLHRGAPVIQSQAS